MRRNLWKIIRFVTVWLEYKNSYVVYNKSQITILILIDWWARKKNCLEKKAIQIAYFEQFFHFIRSDCTPNRLQPYCIVPVQKGSQTISIIYSAFNLFFPTVLILCFNSDIRILIHLKTIFHIYFDYTREKKFKYSIIDGIDYSFPLIETVPLNLFQI